MTYEAIPAVQYTDSHGGKYAFALHKGRLIETVLQSSPNNLDKAAMFIQPLKSALADHRPIYLPSDAYRFRMAWLNSPAADLQLMQVFERASPDDHKDWCGGFGLRYLLEYPIENWEKRTREAALAGSDGGQS